MKVRRPHVCSTAELTLAAADCVLPCCRYEEFKAALEGLDPKRQAASPLPIIHQWREPMGGPGTKCAPAAGLCSWRAWQTE